MLTQLSIRNIVLIESCDIGLKPGLCVLSGETGAGKSILLDSLGLVLGARADASLVRQGEAQGQVTAEFDISANDAAKRIMETLELEAADNIIIRRTLSADGKTRCLLNDQPVTVAALKKLGETLVEIHGQHDQKTLQDMSLHRDMLDAYCSLAAARKGTGAAYRIWKEAAGELEALKATIAQAGREQEYLQHMRNELSQLMPEPGEEEALTTKRTTMMQSEKLFEMLNEVVSELSSGKGAIASIRSAQRVLARSPLAQTQAFSAIIDGLDKAAFEAEEAQFALEKMGEEATFDPNKLEQIEERLFALKAAGRKYNMPVEELATLFKDVEEKLTLIESQEHRLNALQAKETEARKAFLAAAEKLSAGRKKSVGKLEKSVEGELAPLKMENTRFQVRVETLPEQSWSEAGTDGVYFECATNVTKEMKNVAFAPLNKIASGGELSRFMLALKVALAGSRDASTMIFDEIDTGTGGAVADAIGQRLAKLGTSAQVLVVTHLPQVAARGSQHLLVNKKQAAKKIVTEVTELSKKEREEELARMLAGATITPEARKAAQKLLEQAA